MVGINASMLLRLYSRMVSTCSGISGKNSNTGAVSPNTLIGDVVNKTKHRSRKAKKVKSIDEESEINCVQGEVWSQR